MNKLQIINNNLKRGMRNHSPFLLQTIKQNKMSKNLNHNKMRIETHIPNQEKSSFTNYRKFNVNKVNNINQYNNKFIDNQSEKLSLIDYDEIKNRYELNLFIKKNNKKKLNKNNKSK